ncbi:MAG: efflux transporter outer membrane subunit [Desulfobacterales bacterium]|nr:efflux transporter outer membrane subunit [Desulfobacterales bacterium]
MLLAVGCTLRQAAPAPDPVMELPQAFSGQKVQAVSRAKWWRTFENDELDRLILAALSANLTLEEAWARLRQVRAQAVGAGAGRFPDLTVTAGAAHSRQRADTTSPPARATDQYTLGLTSRYELDLWGRIRSEQEAAVLSAAASREDLAAAATTVVAAVTERWLGIVAQRMHRARLFEQIKTNETMLELVELRFRKSMSSALDVLQQRQVVERSLAQLPLVDRDEQLLINELALLLGQMPPHAPEIRTESVDLPATAPEAGLPIQLLTKRPDVRAAAKRLRAADRRVAAARADRLPNLRLTASGLVQAGQTAILLENWLISLAADLTAPIFDGDRRLAAVDAASAEAEQFMAVFKKTVLTAVKEVEDALVREAALRRYLAGLEAELAAAERTLDEARSRYRNGLNDYLPVLTALLSVQGLERDLIDRRTDLILARVGLYRALGGAWTDDLEP